MTKIATRWLPFRRSGHNGRVDRAPILLQPKAIALLPAQPIVSAPTVRAEIGTSQQQVLQGLKSLEEAGVLSQISEGSYDRQFAAPELLDMVTAYEDRIAGRLDR